MQKGGMMTQRQAPARQLACWYATDCWQKGASLILRGLDWDTYLKVRYAVAEERRGKDGRCAQPLPIGCRQLMSCLCISMLHHHDQSELPQLPLVFRFSYWLALCFTSANSKGPEVCVRRKSDQHRLVDIIQDGTCLRNCLDGTP